MAAAEEVQFSLKVVMIKESNKVLYAEIDSDFADVLLSFLTLPLGTIVRLLIKHYGDDAPILGSLNSLYAGLLNMDIGYFWTEAGKLMMLNPRNSSEIECGKLKLQIDDTPLIQNFVCKNGMCVNIHYSLRCFCPETRNTTSRMNSGVEDKSAFVAKTASFLLIDDLQILTNTPALLFRLLKLNGVNDTNTLEERTLILGLKEVNLCYIDLLVWLPLLQFITFLFFIFLLFSSDNGTAQEIISFRNSIADMVLHIRSEAPTFNEIKKFSASGEFEPNALPKSQTNENVNSDSKRITVKVFVQKSTNRFLFVQARRDFIDFLFSLLTIPLGRVQSLLGSSTYLGSINNLYRSISNSEIVECMKSREMIIRLVEPEIHPHYLFLHQIRYLNRLSSPTINHEYQDSYTFQLLASTPGFGYTQVKMIDPKGEHSFVKGPATFMVTDDLVVSTPSSTSIISNLNQMKIPISDAEEQELDIGVEEALSILRASLASTRALSEGLKPFLGRQQNQEK